jgi:DNA helicase-2/ATP-dependent DNA helicase PcrA
MHRAAYLMYRQRETLTSESIAVVSPSASFGEYISNVLPELGEENIKAIILHSALSALIGSAVEPPADQNEALLDPKNAQRRAGVRIKSDAPFIALLDEYTERYFARGPMFEDLAMRKHLLAGKRELERLYREQFKMLTPAQRLTRIQTIMEARLAEWEKSLLPQYIEQLSDSYRGKELNFVSQMAVTQQLHPIRTLLKNMLSPHPLKIYADALKGFDRSHAKIAAENSQANLVYWEDAPGITYLLIKLGFIKPDLSIRHLIVDEVQDYTDIALRFMKLYYPRAHMTLLGDPHQRTLPGLNECEPERWGESLNDRHSPVIKLSRVYRSTMEITEFCNELLAARDMPLSFGRHGESPERAPYSLESLNEQISRWQGQGYRRIAIITRSRKDTERLRPWFSDASVLLNHSDELDFSKDITLASFHYLKGLEFDAVAAVWPCAEEPADDERRRMYTACSRALHRLCLFNLSS